MPMHDWTRVGDGEYHDFHTAWIAELRKVLNRGGLPKGYYALAEQQTGEVGPDVLTLRSPGEDEIDTDDSGGIAVALLPPRVEFTAESNLKAYTSKRKTLVIRHRSGNRIIAMIELVSPGNKKTRRQMSRFVRKVAKVLSAGIHVLVVDPFPPDRSNPNGIHGAIWIELEGEEYQRPIEKPLTLASYSAGQTNTAYVQPYSVGQPLKEMPLFLSAERYVLVALEATYMAAWEGTPDEVREQLTSSPNDASPEKNR